jgi:hypothetical protein
MFFDSVMLVISCHNNFQGGTLEFVAGRVLARDILVVLVPAFVRD